VTATVEEERDGLVPGHGSDGMELATAVVTTWMQPGWRRRRRGRREFWQPDDVQVNILRLGFKDRAAGGFIGGPQ
jgi:hypothetical protein